MNCKRRAKRVEVSATLPTIIDGLKIDAGDGSSDFCIWSCLRTIVNYFGILNPELQMVSRWDFAYSSEMGLESEFTSMFHYDGDEYRGFRRSGFEVIVDRSDDALATWQANKQVIDSLLPVIAVVDLYYMPNNPHPSEVDIHLPHGVIIHGYDDDASLAWVIDAWPGHHFQGQVSVDTLMKARSSSVSLNRGRPPYNNPVRNYFMYLVPPPNILTLDFLLKLYVQDSLQSLDSPDDRGVNYCFGPEAIGQFANDLQNIVVAGDGKSSSQEQFERLFLKLIPVIHQRQLGAAVFATARGAHGAPLFDSLQKHTMEGLQLWRVLHNMILRASRSSRQDVETTLSKLANRLESVADLEATVYRLMRQV